jgi:hypothetical protein
MWLVLLRIALVISLVLPPLNLRINQEGAPMAVEFISDLEFEGDEAQSGYESSITIPDGTTAIVVGAALEFNTGADPTFSALNWDSGGLDFTLAVKENGVTYGNSGTVLYVLTSDDTGWPGTGSGKTLSWVQSHGISQAPQIWVGFFKGVDTADPIGATTWSDGSDDDNTNVSHTSSLGTVDADDMSIMASYYWGNPPTNAGSGQTLFANMSGDFQSLFVVGELGESSLNVTGLDYPITAAFVLQAAAAGGTTVDVTLGTLTIAGYNPTVVASVSISATLETVAVAGYAATVEPTTAIAAATGALTIDTFVHNVNVGTDIDSSLGALTIADLNATITAGTSIDASAGAVIIAGYNPDVSTEIVISAALGTVDIAGLNPTILVGTDIDVAVGAVTIAGLAATVGVGTDIDVSTGAAVIAGYNPVVDLSGATTILPTTGALTIAGANPTISVGTDITASAGAVVIASHNPTVEPVVAIDATLATLAIAAYNPTMSVGDYITVSLGTLAIAGYNSSISLTSLIPTPDERTHNISEYERVIAVEASNRNTEILDTSNTVGINEDGRTLNI